jgi:hypothetical protein
VSDRCRCLVLLPSIRRRLRATVFFTEVMPILPPGVIYGFHEIFLQSNCPLERNGGFPSEQYLLMTYLSPRQAREDGPD